jgi:hypothetical protein
VIQISSQDGRQAKNRKNEDEIFKKSSPLKSLVPIGPVVSEEKIFM